MDSVIYFHDEDGEWSLGSEEKVGGR